MSSLYRQDITMNVDPPNNISMTNQHISADNNGAGPALLSVTTSSTASTAVSTTVPGYIPLPVPPVPPLPSIDPVTNRVLTTLSQPFVYGTSAKWLGTDADPNHTHQWTVFLRGLENEDLSYIFSSISFHLHSSFAEPTRTLSTPPFQITESGWGEFAIIITLHFHPSAALNDINITHQLKLFPPANTIPTVGQPVISETYEELVFHHPIRDFYNILIRGPLGRFESDAIVLASAREFAREEQEQLVKLVASANHIKARLDRERQRLFSVDQDITLLTNRI